jgi:hypothetical protein
MFSFYFVFRFLSSSLTIVSLKNFILLREELKIDRPDCKFEIKTHLHFPSCGIFVVDNVLILNPILPLERGKETAHIRYNIGKKEVAAKTQDFIQTFEYCWRDAEEAKKEYVFDEKKLEVWKKPKTDIFKRSQGDRSTTDVKNPVSDKNVIPIAEKEEKAQSFLARITGFFTFGKK